MQKRILIIDDDKCVREMLGETFTYCDYTVKTLGPSKDLIELIDEFSPDLMLIDYLLHTINGGDLCHDIKSNQNTASIPVIMISAYVPLFPESTINDCDAILAKPFDLNELLETVDTLTQ